MDMFPGWLPVLFSPGPSRLDLAPGLFPSASWPLVMPGRAGTITCPVLLVLGLVDAGYVAAGVREDEVAEPRRAHVAEGQRVSHEQGFIRAPPGEPGRRGAAGRESIVFIPRLPERPRSINSRTPEATRRILQERLGPSAGRHATPAMNNLVREKVERGVLPTQRHVPVQRPTSRTRRPRE
jgi:hypothetical protein